MSLDIGVTAAEVRAIREQTGEGMMTIKARLLRECALAAVEDFRQSGDRQTLADVLEYLVKEKHG